MVHACLAEELIYIWCDVYGQLDNLRKGMIDLQEVVAFFRREKEVAEANKQVRI